MNKTIAKTEVLRWGTEKNWDELRRSIRNRRTNSSEIPERQPQLLEIDRIPESYPIRPDRRATVRHFQAKFGLSSPVHRVSAIVAAGRCIELMRVGWDSGAFAVAHVNGFDLKSNHGASADGSNSSE